jgi:hypothetical protein
MISVRGKQLTTSSKYPLALTIGMPAKQNQASARRFPGSHGVALEKFGANIQRFKTRWAKPEAVKKLGSVPRFNHTKRGGLSVSRIGEDSLVGRTTASILYSIYGL